MNAKLVRSNFLKDFEKKYIDSVNDGKSHTVKLTTNRLDFDRDRKDERNIAALKNIKVIYQIQNGGCLLLMGNLGCSFREPFGSEFYVKRATIEEKSDFKDIEGVSVELNFTNIPTDINLTQDIFAKILDNPRFKYDLSQFDEFMDIFNFYKELSSELNNNISYPIHSVSQPYYFVPTDVKDIEVDDANAIINLNGIVIGYVLEKYKYEGLTSEQQEKVILLSDIIIKEDDIAIKQIRRFHDNLYVSKFEKINEDNVKQIHAFNLSNIYRKENGQVVLSGEANINSGDNFLNLYDMGQKVKLESIDNSLRLINQGASGAAVELLEYIIGSKAMPSKKSKGLIDRGKKKNIYNLDESQRQAFLMATDGSPISLIKGPPGTGKTYVINAIVQYITKELKEKVVISSQTHVAIDNVLDKLMENYDLIIPNRITNRRNKYSEQEIDVTLYKTWAKKFNEHNNRSSKRDIAKKIEEDLKNFKGEKKFRFSNSVNMSDYSVIGATTTTSAIGGKKGLDLLNGYDWLIIDEVSKCPITEVLRYLPYVKKIIMVGDDFQLAPLLEFNKEDVKNLDSYDDEKFSKLKTVYEQSVFAKTLKKAEKAGRLALLNVNYRSVSKVLNAYNVFYNNQLINYRENVKPSKVQFKEKFSTFNDKDIFFVNVKFGKEARDNTSRYNIEELFATAEILSGLLKNVVNPSSVSVSAIFPYAAQIEMFQKDNIELINKAKKIFKNFEIDTVDAFQGKETDIVLVNTVVTDSSQGNFLNDFRRINVSMSRARDKLFIFGNPNSLSKIEMKVSNGNKRRYFAEIIEDIKRFGAFIQYEGVMRYESTSKDQIKIV